MSFYIGNSTMEKEEWYAVEVRVEFRGNAIDENDFTSDVFNQIIGDVQDLPNFRYSIDKGSEVFFTFKTENSKPFLLFLTKNGLTATFLHEFVCAFAAKYEHSLVERYRALVQRYQSRFGIHSRMDKYTYSRVEIEMEMVNHFAILFDRSVFEQYLDNWTIDEWFKKMLSQK